MPLQDESESSTTFKSADIKTMFLAATSARKRKASSPIPFNEAKSVKVCDDDIQVIDVIADSAVHVGDSKENKDLNTVKNEQCFSINGGDFVEKEQIICSKENSTASSGEESHKSSFDDLNSSQLNSSMNPLNTSGLSETNLDKNADDQISVAITNSKFENTKDKDDKKSNTRKRKRMTPEEAKLKAEEREKKQQEKLMKKQELEAKKLEREREIQQRKLQKEMEKRAKEEERKEKERLRLEKKEQEEKEKQMRLEERETQKRIRQMELELKLEMKKKKEEMKQKQEEERKKLEEEKKKAELEKEQKEKEKRERAKAAFVKFFKKENISPPPPTQKLIEAESAFKPFQISEDMTLAPVVPAVAQERFNREKLDAVLKSQSNQELYLQILKNGSYHDVRHRKKQRKPRFCDADVIIESNQTELHLSAKLLQFSENVRPPYWGTWRKRSKYIRPRNPFGQDDIFDYSVDSDDEWDEGGPGESLSGTEPEDESEDDYEVDNEFFVPHGYLSAEEEKKEDENEQDDEVVNDPEKQKAVLKKKLQEFEMERKKKTTELKPIILGCYIENSTKSQNNSLRSLLEPNAVVLLSENPILTCFTVKSESKPNSNASSPTSSASSALKCKKNSVPEEAMPHLIRLVHGNHHSLAFLIPEFQKFWKQQCTTSDQMPTVEKTEEKPTVDFSSAVLESPSSDSIISKRQLIKTLRQIASKRPIDGTKKSLWMVNEDILVKYDLLNLPIPNTWSYISTDNKEDIDLSPVVKPVNPSIKEFLTL